jgi:hypothetical protein
MANQLPNFSFNPGVTPLQLAQMRQQQQQQAFEDQRQVNSDQMDRIKEVSGLASTMVQSMVSMAAKRQLNQSIDTLSKAPPELVPQLGAAPGPGKNDIAGPSYLAGPYKNPTDATVNPSPLQTGYSAGSVSSPVTDANGNMTASGPMATSTSSNALMRNMAARKLAAMRIAELTDPTKLGERSLDSVMPLIP